MSKTFELMISEENWRTGVIMNDSSKSTARRSFKNVLAVIGYTEEQLVSGEFIDTCIVESCKLSADTYAHSTRYSQLKYLISFLRWVNQCCSGGVLDTYLDGMEMEDYELHRNRISVMPDDKFVPEDEVLRVLDGILDGTITATVHEKLSLWMIVRICPFRTQELIDIVIDDPDSPNNIDLLLGVISINKQKSKKNGERIFSVPKEIIDFISDNSDLFNGKLFNMPRTTFAGMFHRFTKRVFGKGLGTSAFRTMKVSQSVEGLTTEERQDLAKSMGHTAMAQAKYYNHFVVPQISPQTPTDTDKVLDLKPKITIGVKTKTPETLVEQVTAIIKRLGESRVVNKIFTANYVTTEKMEEIVKLLPDESLATDFICEDGLWWICIDCTKKLSLAIKLIEIMYT
jgi:integrase